MNTFIGTKVISARPMTRGDYNTYRGWTLPSNENGADTGYLVEYAAAGMDQVNDVRHAGYISWSPTKVFEEAYKPTSSMTFGDALVMIKTGYKVARAGWNGKGMWLALSGPLQGRRIPAESFWSVPNRTYAHQLENEQGARVNVLPCITMKTADGSILMGWLASQSDMLAEDWMVVA